MNCKQFVAMGLVLALPACGSTQEERGLSGAGIGAAAGAVVGAVTGLSVVEGVLIGAAAGGITGVVTDKSQVDLGEPIWKRGGSKQSAAAAPASAGESSSTVRNIQSGLAKLGYAPGPADGRAGPRTRSAIREYQERNQLLVDGQPSEALWAHIQQRI